MVAGNPASGFLPTVFPPPAAADGSADALIQAFCDRMYSRDSHNCQRIVLNGMVKNEGDIQRAVPAPYPISCRSIVPKSVECPNLLVPWGLSASHIAFGSIRMEPVFMNLGQSAATAAAFAIDDDIAVQAVPYSKLKAQLLADK